MVIIDFLEWRHGKSFGIERDDLAGLGADEQIAVRLISTSEIKISVLVAAEYTELAVRALHTAYELDAP